MNCETIQYDAGLLSIVHAAHRSCGQKVSPGRSEKCYVWNGAANFLVFWNEALCMHLRMFVKNPCLLSGFTSFAKLIEGNVSCLQMQYDRMDTANLRFDVKTCYWHLARRKSKSEPEKNPTDMWMKIMLNSGSAIMYLFSVNKACAKLWSHAIFI